jgi:hypothetical protein
MYTRKKERNAVIYKTPPLGDKATRTAELLALQLGDEADLSIADDAGLGGDPYNSTGEHLIPSQRLRKR